MGPSLGFFIIIICFNESISVGHVEEDLLECGFV